MVGRIREIVFEDGIDVDGIVTDLASEAYVNALFDPVTGNSKGILLDNTSGLPTLSPWRAGVIAWDTQNKCMAVSTSYSGSWMQVGQETTDDAVNKTGGALANGTVVYFESSQGNRPKMWKAYCTDDAISLKTIGLVTQDAGIADNAEGPVTTSGVVRNLNTNAYTEGDLLWLDTVAGGYTKTLPSYQYNHIMIGIVIKSHLTQGEIYVSVKDLTDQLAKAGFHIVDPHGFTEYDNTYMTRSWVGNTFTLTQVGTKTPYFCMGKQKYLTGNKSITVTPTLGGHFIGLNCATEVLEDLGGTIPTASIISTHVLCEFCYADGVNVKYKSNERHTTKFLKRDWFYKHLYLSTQYRSGIQPSITSIDGNGSSNTHAQFSTTSGMIADEDIEIAIASTAAGDSKRLWYYNGTKWITEVGLDGSGVINVGFGARASYNNITTGLVTCSNNYHVLTHLFAANDGTLIGIIGIAEYQLISQARTAASNEIASLITTGLPFPEFRAIATYINKTSSYTNSTKSIIVSVNNGVPFIDWRKTALNPVAGQNASNHQNLSGIQGGQTAEYYHLTEAKYNEVISGTLVSTDGVQALTNKDIDGGTASNTNRLTVPVNTKTNLDGLTRKEGTLAYASDLNTLYADDGSNFIAMASTSTVQAITNKDIDGGTASNSNRLTVPVNTKTNLDGLTRKEGTLVYASDLNTLYADDGSNLVPQANTSGVQVFTNKDIDGGTASNSNRLTVPVNTKTNLDGLTRKEGTLAYASDLDTLYADDGSYLVPVGSSSSGGEKNYITNPSAAISIAGWVTSDASKLSVTRTITAGELPRNNTTKTGIKILSVAGGDSTNAYVYHTFMLDNVDLVGKLITISFSLRKFGDYEGGKLKLYIAYSGAPQSILINCVDTDIPHDTVVFNTSFTTTSTDSLALVFKSSSVDMNDDVGIVISDVVITRPNIGLVTNQSQNFTGIKTFTNGIIIPNTQSTVFNYFEEGSFSAYIQDGVNAAEAIGGDIYYVRIGNLVTMKIPDSLMTNTQVGRILTTSSTFGNLTMPPQLMPLNRQYCAVRVKDGTGLDKPGSVAIDPIGYIQIYEDLFQGSFSTNNQEKGLIESTISYILC